MADMFTMQTPKGEAVQVPTKNGRVAMELRWADDFGRNMTVKIRSVQAYVDQQVLRLNEPYIPKDTGALKQSGILFTNIGEGEVKYRTVYARRWYYMPARFQQGSGSGMNTVGRGNYWFERMKREHLQKILAGARREFKQET